MRQLDFARKNVQQSDRRHSARMPRRAANFSSRPREPHPADDLVLPAEWRRDRQRRRRLQVGTVSWGMPLYTIYWGSWWTNTSDGQTLQSQIQNSLDSIFYDSAFLSGLQQYGVPHPAGVNGSGTVEVNNTSDPSNGFSDSDVQNVVNNAIDNQGMPDSDTYTNEGLYVVFTPPNVQYSNSNDAGYHTYETVWDPSPSDLDTRHYAWVGDFGGLNSVTTLLSHEVMESMTDPNGDAIQVLPRSTSSWNEICDNEAQNYTAFLNGYQVQSFWSQSDGNYAIYDGNSQTVTDDGGDLIVNGGQTGYYNNDTVSVDQNSEAGCWSHSMANRSRSPAVRSTM